MAALVIVSTVQALENYSSDTDTDSSSDEEWYTIKEKQKRIRSFRIQDYVQSVVTRYEDFEFKSHFRLADILFIKFKRLYIRMIMI